MKFLFCLCFGFFTLQHIAGQGIIKGRVLGENEILSNAIVVLEKTSIGTTTDQHGQFMLDSLPAGNYTLMISYAGFHIYRKNIIIDSKEEIFVEARLHEEIEAKEEVVVTGNLKETYISKSPIKVDILTPVLFKKNPTPTIFEALQMVNGVQPQVNCNVCNTGDIHINGMEGPYTMVTIDGMPIVSALGTVYGLSGIPNSIIKRVEIVKGPASTLYGSEAVGGLINIITKDPLDAPLFYADVFGTSQQELNFDVSVKSIYGKNQLLTGINYFHFKNLLDVNKDNFTDIPLQSRISVFNKINIFRKSEKAADIALRYIYEDRWGGELQWDKSFRGGDSIYGESVFTNRWELIGNYQLPVKEKITFQYSLNTHFQNSAYGNMMYVGKQNIAFGQLLWNKSFGLRNDLLLGVPLRYTFYDDNTPGTERNNGTENAPQKILLPGIFLQNEFKVNEKFLMLTGIRYDYNSDHGNIFSPRVAFKYNLNQNNVLRLSAGNGYRVVNLFTEDHAALTGARKVVISDDLKPEKSWNANINYQTHIIHNSGFIGLEGGLFYTYFTNKIIGDFLKDPDFIFYNNLAGHAISKGIVVNTDFEFTSGVKAMIGATIMDVYSVNPENSEKIPQLHAPGISGTFALTYPLKAIGLSIDYTGRITGPMELPVANNDFRPSRSPWFSIQNIQVTKKIRNRLEIYGGVKNILNFIPKNPLLRPFDPFDKRAFNADGSPSGENPNGYTFDPSYNYAPVQGRRFFFGVRVTFINQKI